METPAAWVATAPEDYTDYGGGYEADGGWRGNKDTKASWRTENGGGRWDNSERRWEAGGRRGWEDEDPPRWRDGGEDVKWSEVDGRWEEASLSWNEAEGRWEEQEGEWEERQEGAAPEQPAAEKSGGMDFSQIVVETMRKERGVSTDI